MICTKDWPTHLHRTLIDHVDVIAEKLADAGHQGGAKCRCCQCEKLKDCEDKWICRLGAFHGPSGLNSRDEIKGRSRINFVGHWNQNLTLSVYICWSYNWILLCYVGLTLICYFHYYFVNIFCSLMYCHHLMCNCARRRL